MSQAGILNVIENNPTIPIYFEGDTGFAVALFNVIQIVGVGGIVTSASGNTITIDGSGAGPDLTITGNTGGPISPVGDNWDLVATNTTLNVAGTPGTLTLDFGISNLIFGNDAITLIGANNVGIGNGLYALSTTANSNTFAGNNTAAPMPLTTGDQNCGFGQNALGALQSGGNNYAFGYLAGVNYTGAESRNIVIGNVGTVGESDTVRIGDNHTRFFGSGISGVTVAASAPVGVNSNNQLSSLGFGSANQVLTSNGAGASPTWQATSGSLITTYTANGSWTPDPRAKTVRILAWGGGGGGSSGNSAASGSAGGGGGGGAGSFFDGSFDAASLLAAPYAVTIGQGGTGGASVIVAPRNSGMNGGNTTVGSIVLALGGRLGATSGGAAPQITVSAISTTGIAAGTGTNLGATPIANSINGSATSGGGGSGYALGTPRIGGGAGAITDQASTVIVAAGAAGANTGANAGNGNSPVNQAIMIGGTGGGGGGTDGNVTAGSGGNGGFPAGGGGGGGGNVTGSPSGAGGNGANGMAIIIEYF